MRNPGIRTAPNVANQMAELLGKRRRILDLGAGDGVLLEAALSVSGSDTELIGYDIVSPRVGPPEPIDLRTEDVLSLDLEEYADGVISNPPYERLHDLAPEFREELRTRFESAHSSFDLWFVFIEKALQLLEPNGRAVFLIPDGFDSRPAAALLRDVVGREAEWGLVPPVAPAFDSSVGVAPTILVIDKNPDLSSHARRTPNAGMLGPSTTARAHVGVATGADDVYLRQREDSWLRRIESRFIRPTIGGGDVRGGVRRRQFIVWPYERARGLVKLANLDRAPGLRAFCEAHRSRLLARSRPEHHGYIQNPKSAVAGWRVVVPDVFREPRLRIVADGVIVRNSAFVVPVSSREEGEEVASQLSCAIRPSTIGRYARRISSGYYRTSVSGLNLLLSDALR